MSQHIRLTCYNKISRVTALSIFSVYSPNKSKIESYIVFWIKLWTVMTNTVRFKEVTRSSILFHHLTWSERANIKIEPAYRIFVILPFIWLELTADITGDCQVMCPYFRQCYRRSTVKYYKFCRTYTKLLSWKQV